jgi:uncharacterized protein YeeX (DUF496 family)
MVTEFTVEVVCVKNALVGRLSEQAATSPQHECIDTVKEMTAEVMREKNALVRRLNTMNQKIAEEEDPVTKVRRKVEWTAEKERSVEALNKIVASLRRAHEEEDGGTHGSNASLRDCAISAASRPHGALNPSYTNKHASSLDNNQEDFDMTVVANIDPDFSYETSQGAGDVEPRNRVSRCASEPLCKTASLPPTSKAAGVLRSLSSEASQLSEQVRKFLRNRARKVSASMLRSVGWDPALQESQWVWEQRLKVGFGV